MLFSVKLRKFVPALLIKKTNWKLMLRNKNSQYGGDWDCTWLFWRTLLTAPRLCLSPGIWLVRWLKSGRRWRKMTKLSRRCFWNSWRRSCPTTWPTMPSTRRATFWWRSRDSTCWRTTSMKTPTAKSACTLPGRLGFSALLRKQTPFYVRSMLYTSCSHVDTFVFGSCRPITFCLSPPAVWVMFQSQKTRRCWDVPSISSESSTAIQRPCAWPWCSTMSS